MNLAFGSQSIMMDERVLENYIDRFSDGAVLYIPVSYSSLLSASSDRSDFLSLNRRYYYFLRRDLIINFSWREWLAVKSPGLFIPNWEAQYWTVDEFDEAGVQTADTIDVQADANAAVQRHILVHEKNGEYTYNEETLLCLNRIIALCKDHQITPVLITTPFLREYNDLVPKDFLDMQRSYLNTLAAEQQIEYLDFSQDVRFIDRYDLFLNSDHLNDNGALIFTDLLLDGGLPSF
ncbi:MAG: hypothetical protein GX417_03275 [Clostridiales bacterium]|nr:hypothetical protein [Clostridiales bacterium]